MAKAPRHRPRLPAFLANGILQAYALVLGLILACAAVAGVRLANEPVPASQRTSSAVAAAARSHPFASLKLPPSSQLKVDFRRLPAVELEDMVEVTGEGVRLPRISTSGWMPWIAYARRFDPHGPAARVGLLMLNVGADEALTRRAIEELPPEVSLAFLAGTSDLTGWLRLARERGHECYLMLPVEDPAGPAERGIRPIEGSVDPAE